MATVATPQFIPRRERRGGSFLDADQLLRALVEKKQQRQEEERESQETAQRQAAGVAATEALNQLIAGASPSSARRPEAAGIDPVASAEFTRQLLASGGTPQQAVSTIMQLEGQARETREEARQQAALAELGRELAKKGGARSEFAGDVLSDKGLDTGMKISILNQTGVLFPEPRDKTFKDVKLFTRDGKERIIRVPSNVTDPQAFIEREMPALARAGFSTTKPAETATPTETEKDVSSIVNTNPVLQHRLQAGEIDRKEATELARIAFRDRDKVITQLERDFAEISETGLTVGFKSSHDQIMFDLARRNVTSVYASGTTDLGEVVSRAKDLANQQFENLEFLPDNLRLTPERATDFDHLARVVEFFLEDETEMLGGGFDTSDDRFQEVVRLLKNRLSGWTDTHTEELRLRVFGEGEEPDEEGEGFIQRLFSR